MGHTEPIFTNSSREKFAKYPQMYSIVQGWVGWGRRGSGHPSCCPTPLPCRALYCTSVRFTNFVRELLVNIPPGGSICTSGVPCCLSISHCFYFLWINFNQPYSYVCLIATKIEKNMKSRRVDSISCSFKNLWAYNFGDTVSLCIKTSSAKHVWLCSLLQLWSAWSENR